MHYLVRLIIEADDSATAIDQAKCAMDALIEQREFDWYREEGDESAWEGCWKPMPLESNTAKAWIKDAMDSQFAEFNHSMTAIRHMVLNYNNEQIFDEDFGENREMHPSRYYFSKASGYHANASLLYDTYGSAITSNTDLRSYIDQSKSYWVIQVDCHN
jgi:hypothetical protein